MKITAAFAFYPEEQSLDKDMPQLISCYDNFTEDRWGGVPSFHVAAIHGIRMEATRTGAHVVIRECTFAVPEQKILDLFSTNEEIPVRNFQPKEKD